MAEITDISIDVCEHFLKDLKFLDFFQTALTNQHLQSACQLEFPRRFAEREFVLSLVEIVPEYCDESENLITIYGLKFILKFLRVFGDSIKNLKLSFPIGNCVNGAFHVVKYLERFCARSVRKITIQNVYYDIFEFFSQPLLNVNEISIVSSNVSREFHRVVTFFPNVRAINFSGWNTICECPPGCRCIFEGCCLFQALQNFGIVVHYH